MSYYSPYAQWPAGFQIKFNDYLIQQIRFSASSLSPEYAVIKAVKIDNFVHIDVNVQGGKQSDDSRPISTTIIS